VSRVQVHVHQIPPCPKRSTSAGLAVVTAKMTQVNVFVRKHFVHLISVIAFVAFLSPRNRRLGARVQGALRPARDPYKEITTRTAKLTSGGIEIEGIRDQRTVLIKYRRTVLSKSRRKELLGLLTRVPMEKPAP
jgi:hypothetical protein